MFFFFFFESSLYFIFLFDRNHVVLRLCKRHSQIYVTHSLYWVRLQFISQNQLVSEIKRYMSLVALTAYVSKSTVRLLWNSKISRYLLRKKCRIRQIISPKTPHFFFSRLLVKTSNKKNPFVIILVLWRGSVPASRGAHLRSMAPKKRRSGDELWRHCANLTKPGIEHQTSSTDSVVLKTELTGLWLVVVVMIRIYL